MEIPNPNIFNAIKSYLAANEDEKKVILETIIGLDKLPLHLGNYICEHVFDNTENGDDTVKTSWQSEYVDYKTEAQFYLDVDKTEDGFKSSFYKWDKNSRFRKASLKTIRDMIKNAELPLE